MKKLYTLLVLVLATCSIMAQNFVFTTEQHPEVIMTEGYSSTYIKFETPSPEAITYMYETRMNTLPTDWSLSLCDYQSCYQGVPSSGIMTEITLANAQNGIKGFFSLTINADDSGEGMVEIYVYDSKDYNRGELVSWRVTYDDSVATFDLQEKESFDVYPNPASDFIQFESETFISGDIFNSFGQRMVSFDTRNTSIIDVSTLNKGMYFVSARNKNGVLVNRQLVVQ